MLNFSKILLLSLCVDLLTAPSDSESDDNSIPRGDKIRVEKGMVKTRANNLSVDQSTRIYGLDYEETEEDDLRDSFSSILGISNEEYQAHESTVKKIYQESLINDDFSQLEEIAERGKGSLRSPFAKAFLSHILLNGLIVHDHPEEESVRHADTCITFFKKLHKNKRSGVSLFLKGSLYEYEFKKTGKAEKKNKAFNAYTKAAKEFQDDEAQIRLGDWHKKTSPTIARKWFERAKNQGNQRARHCLQELDDASRPRLRSLEDNDSTSLTRGQKMNQFGIL